jgi:hypothetical protein
MEEIGADLLRGVRRIAHFINEDPRATYHKLSRGYLPGGKEGSEWIASKSVLRAHYARLTGAIIAVKPQTKKQTEDRAARMTDGHEK